jgi:Zn-dependent peptidase ImmA (M78 family)/transcriptional regulator with XRE-family HTH domain
MISGDRVRQARELHSMTQSALTAEVPELSQPRLSRIEKGLADLGEDELTAAMIAATTGVTVDWLARPPSSGLSGLSPHFRARSRTTQSTKAAGLAWANLVNEAHDLLAGRIHAVPMRFEPLHDQSPQDAARTVRRQLGFNALEPLPYLILAAERLGVRVLGLPWSASTIDAFSAWANDVPTIALASDVAGDRLRWTFAHELGHLVLHDSASQGKHIEADADSFAAELLTPLDALRMQMPAHPTVRTLTMLKSQWGVSVKSLVRRARELGTVDDERATSLYRQISARGWNKVEPGYVPREKPRALRRSIEVIFGRADAECLAHETRWSVEVAELVLDQHARVDELPHAEDTGFGGFSDVVVPLDRNRSAQRLKL